MSPLRGIVRDLVDRRLWPLAALLIVGLIAVPVLVLRPAPAALDQSATSTPAAVPAAAPTAAAATAPPATGTADAASDPSVALTSSPFAAAFGAGLNLPPSMEGLLKSTKGADKRAVVAGAPLHDPFAGALGAAAAPADASTTAAPTGAAPSASSSAASPAAPSSSPSGPTGSTGPAPDTATPSESAPASTPDPKPAPASKPAVDDGSSAAGTRTIFHANVRFGTASVNPMVSDAKRLTAFPSSFEPVAVFLGVMRGGWGAAFALREGAQPVGAPSCRPRKQICTWVILHPGEEVALNVKDPTTGAVTPYKLKLDKVTKTTVTPDAAKIAAQRTSTAGRCLLGPLAAYRYDTESGTLAPRPELNSCRYRTPAQAETAAVRVAHIG